MRNANKCVSNLCRTLFAFGCQEITQKGKITSVFLPSLLRPFLHRSHLFSSVHPLFVIHISVLPSSTTFILCSRILFRTRPPSLHFSFLLSTFFRFRFLRLPVLLPFSTYSLAVCLSICCHFFKIQHHSSLSPSLSLAFFTSAIIVPLRSLRITRQGRKRCVPFICRSVLLSCSFIVHDRRAEREVLLMEYLAIFFIISSLPLLFVLFLHIITPSN